MRIPKRIGIWQESRFESVIQLYEFELPLNQKQNQSMNQDRMPMTVGILIFDQVEVLDVTGPFEVFSVTRLSEERRQEESSPFRVLLVAEKIDQVLAIGGLRLTPDVTFENCPKLDLQTVNPICKRFLIVFVRIS